MPNSLYFIQGLLCLSLVAVAAFGTLDTASSRAWSSSMFVCWTCSFWALIATLCLLVRRRAVLAAYCVAAHTLVALGIMAWIALGTDVEPWMRSFALMYVDLPLLPIVRLLPEQWLYLLGPLLSLLAGGSFYGVVGWALGSPAIDRRSRRTED